MKYDRAVLLVRAPEEALLEEFNRRYAGHLGHAQKLHFKKGIHKMQLFVVVLFVVVINSAVNGTMLGIDCRDKVRKCSYWASTGECTNSSRYMRVSCCRSCNSCIDQNPNCRYWAQSGQCYKNPNNMHSRCCESCNLYSRGRGVLRR
ncbi:uncharacterized protein LOC143075711 isoform X1 [Mytilus galloprovincialis]|uniref:uncharacterized protein LOC143075711 isoform X1 n=1 Tax=Mytilus galloprovincialis TaxID=29158 RepID=UPI003F7C1B77